MSLRSGGQKLSLHIFCNRSWAQLPGTLCYGDRSVLFPLIMQQRDLEEETWFSFIFSKSKKMQTIFSGRNSIHSSDFLSDSNLLLSSLPCLCSWTLSVLFHEKVFLNHCFLVLRVSWLLLEKLPAPCKHSWLSTLHGFHAAVSLLAFWPVVEGTAWSHLWFYSLDVKRPQIILWNSNFELLQSLTLSAIGASLNPSLPFSEACS